MRIQVLHDHHHWHRTLHNLTTEYQHGAFSKNHWILTSSPWWQRMRNYLGTVWCSAWFEKDLAGLYSSFDVGSLACKQTASVKWSKLIHTHPVCSVYCICLRSFFIVKWVIQFTDVYGIIWQYDNLISIRSEVNMRHLGFLGVLVAQHLQRTGSMVQTKGCSDPGATSSGGTDSPRSTARKICLARYHGKAVQPASNNTVTLCSFFIESATNVQICQIRWFGKGKAHWLFLCGVPALESTTQCSFMFFYWPWPVQNQSEFHEFQSKGCFLSLERHGFSGRASRYVRMASQG